MNIILTFLWITEIRLKKIQKKRCQKEKKKRLWNKLHVTDDTNKIYTQGHIFYHNEEGSEAYDRWASYP